MTDERVTKERLLRAAKRLTRGSGIILRHYSLHEGERRALFERLRHIADRRGITLFLAGDERTAIAWNADGSHGAGKRRQRQLPRSAPVHDWRELQAAKRQGADLIFLSPLFTTRSHPGSTALGGARFAAIARLAGVPVMALGGVTKRHRTLIHALGATGYGAIDSLSR